MRLRPSAAGVWVKCPGSVQFQKEYPDTRDNQAAQDGSLSHDIAAKIILSSARGDMNAPLVETTEIYEAAEIYAHNVATVMAATSNLSPQVEKSIKLDIVHDGQTGTPDCYLDNGETLYIWDYKFGRRPVEVYENWQLINYAIGLINSDTREVVFRIVQPRASHRDGIIREWKTTPAALQAYFKKLMLAASAATGTDPLCVTGRHCRYCKALHACNAATNSAYNAIDYIDNIVPHELNNDEIGIELSILEDAERAINFRKKAIETQVEHLLKSGKAVPGYLLKDTIGSLKWNADTQQVMALGDMMGVNLRKPRDVITATQAIKAGIDKEMIAAYAFRPNNGLKLTKINNSDARRVFGG